MNPGRDPGLQPERTVLAWNRTAAAMAANGVILLRIGFEPDARILLLPGGLMTGFALLLFAAGHRRKLQFAAGITSAPPLRMLVATCACVLLATFAGLWATMR